MECTKACYRMHESNFEVVCCDTGDCQTTAQHPAGTRTVCHTNTVIKQICCGMPTEQYSYIYKYSSTYAKLAVHMLTAVRAAQCVRLLLLLMPAPALSAVQHPGTAH